MMDVCWQWQKNTTLIQRAATLTGGEDLTCGHSCQTPDCSNNGEREEYKRVVEKAKVFKFDITYKKAKTNTYTYAVVT